LAALGYEPGEVDLPLLPGPDAAGWRALQLERSEDFPSDLPDRAHRADGHQDAAPRIPRDDRLRHLVVQLQPVPDDPFGVVGPVLEGGSGQQPPDQFLVVGPQMYRDVRGHAQLHGDLVPCPRLGHGAGHAVEYVSTAGCPGGDERLADDAEHYLVGHQLAAAEVTVNGQAKICTPSDLITQQVTHHDAWDAEVLRDQRTLRPLARTRRPDHQYPHISSPTPTAHARRALRRQFHPAPPSSPPVRWPSSASG
jgi:hypothetical protein